MSGLKRLAHLNRPNHLSHQDLHSRRDLQSLQRPPDTPTIGNRDLLKGMLSMASNFYDKHLPDYCDLDNKTRNCPGFRLGVCENDGGIKIDMGPITDDVDGKTFYRAFLNVQEAEEIVLAFQQAIDRAHSKSKKGNAHPTRVKGL